jgi:hypothetical protein
MGVSMGNKRFWMAFAACYVVLHAFGFLIHGVLLKSSYEAQAAVFRPEDVMNGMMWIMFVNSAIYLWVFCYVFTKGYENKGLMEGVRYGALMGLLISVMGAYDAYVVYPIPYTLALKWFLSGMVVWTALGVVVSLVYKPEAPKAA